jgi:hypothetical protein
VDKTLEDLLEILKDYDYFEVRKIIDNKLITTTVQRIEDDNEE